MQYFIIEVNYRRTDIVVHRTTTKQQNNKKQNNTRTKQHKNKTTKKTLVFLQGLEGARRKGVQIVTPTP